MKAKTIILPALLISLLALTGCETNRYSYTYTSTAYGHPVRTYDEDVVIIEDDPIISEEVIYYAEPARRPIIEETVIIEEGPVYYSEPIIDDNFDHFDGMDDFNFDDEEDIIPSATFTEPHSFDSSDDDYDDFNFEDEEDITPSTSTELQTWDSSNDDYDDLGEWEDESEDYADSFDDF